MQEWLTWCAIRPISWLTVVAVGATLSVAAGAGGLAEAAGVAQGRALAERLCAVCHMNEGQGEKTGPMSTPSFRAIANRPSQDHAQIVAWLRSRPAMMPDHNVTWDEADSLAAYILSLRKADSEGEAAAAK
jgi:mono/diheme cytochrome c family protein